MDLQSLQNGYRSLVVGHDIFQSDRLSARELPNNLPQNQVVEPTQAGESSGQNTEKSTDQQNLDTYA
jgi:hypothetical protein